MENSIFCRTCSKGIAEEVECGRLNLRYCRTDRMLADSLTKLASSEIIDRLLRALLGDLPEVPGQDQAIMASDATWWASLVLRAGGDPALSTSLKAVDSKGPSSVSVDSNNQLKTVKEVEKKKKKRRGKPQKKLTGNQREKRRRPVPRERGSLSRISEQRK